MRMNCEAVVSHSLPLPVGYGLPALSAAGLNGANREQGGKSLLPLIPHN